MTTQTEARRVYAIKRILKLQARKRELQAKPIHLRTEADRKQINSDHNAIKRWEKEIGGPLT